jgi:hypothetical protein
MEGPSEEFRMRIRERMDEISDYGSEEGLEELLAEIEQQLIEDLQKPAPTDPTPLISAMMSWASLASYAVGRFYGPASPWPRNVAGWGTRAVARLQGITSALLLPLRQAANAVGASTYTISVGFPWGISIGLEWP